MIGALAATVTRLLRYHATFDDAGNERMTVHAERASLVGQMLRVWRKSPLLLATVIAACALVLGYNRDLASYIFLRLLLVGYALLLAFRRGDPRGILFTGFLVVAILVVLVIAGILLFRALKHPTRRRQWYIAMTIIGVSPLVAYLAAQFRDEARFLMWAPHHLDVLKQSRNRDGVITTWDSWGGLGWFNVSYLVRDTDDGLRSIDNADAWRKRLGLSCYIVQTDRVWRTLYIVTTSDCEFESETH